MKRLLLLATLALATWGALPSITLAAEECPSCQSWIFRRSYYSHDPVRQVQVGPPTSSPDRGPYYSRSFGVYVQSGYFNNRGFITVGGRTGNQLNVWESWYKTGTQY